MDCEEPCCSSFVPKDYKHNLVPGTITAGGTSLVLRRKKSLVDRVGCK